MFNIKFKTAGGKQFWVDLVSKNKYRVQKNVITKHCRLLDNKNNRIAWGGEKNCLNRFEEATMKFPVLKTGVILIHGIFRAAESFLFLEETLLKNGFDVYSFSYPSTRYSISEHADFLNNFIKRSIKNQNLNFITHSMGGLVLRAFYKSYTLNIPGKTVMIAPPNKGSNWRDMIERIMPETMEIVMGDAGQEMKFDSEFISKLPAPKNDFIIIAGGKGDGKGFNPLLDGDNDFTVTVEETKLNGMSAHYVIPYGHTNIINKKETADIILKYFNEYK